MAQRSYFFDSVAGDRIYNTSDISRVLARLVGRDGVVYGYEGELKVSPTSPEGMSVAVAIGAAFVQGRLFEVYDTPETLTISSADPANPRIDRIVVRLDLSTNQRRAYLAVKTGTPAATPSPPSLQRDSVVYELSLAQVRVEANATSIGVNNITDERANETVCGWIYPGRRVLAGTSSFVGPTGRTISHSIGHTNYRVLITPTANPNGFLGEVWVIKSANAIVVYNSGSATGSFDWEIAEVTA